MIISFGKAEGLASNVTKVIETNDRHLIASLYPGGLVQFVDDKFVPISRSLRPPFNRVGSRILQGRDGQWWVATEEVAGAGVYRFQEPTLQLQHGERLLGNEELGGRWVSVIYEDPAGTIWASAHSNLYRFDPARHAPPFFERITPEFPLAEQVQPGPSPGRHGARALISDGAGSLWIGDMYMLAKYVNGKLTVLEPTDGLPETDPRSFFIDHRGWLWIGLRYRGVSMSTEPAAEHPHFVNYSTQNGLASDTVWSITEDDAGRMYFGTERGLDRLDVASGRIRHFTTADGLAGDHVNHCMKDSRGYIWVATITGISRLDPRAELAASQAPSVYLSHIQIAGEDMPVAETGASGMTQIELPASRNNLLIQYTGIDFHDNHRLRYQYELEGVDADWSAPTEQMTVNYARLAPGAYRFLVRAVNEDGVASLAPAVLQFRILPPLWQRGWFIFLSMAAVCLMAYAVHRYRVARLIELERVRTRIATDLHDDIGSSLSRMAILSEVAKRRMEGSANDSVTLLNEIADSARAVVNSMSDIVWAIDPRRDDLRNVVFRVRQFASDLLGAQGIAWSLHAPAEFERMKLNPQQRRQLFLIFKEAINNSARHADCKSVWLSLVIDHNRIVAGIRDDGRGFAVASLHQPLGNGGGGHGLDNIRARVAQLGGQLDIESSPDRGTTIKLVIPLNKAMA
jgi:signal transduction histidine kinase